MDTNSLKVVLVLLVTTTWKSGIGQYPHGTPDTVSLPTSYTIPIGTPSSIVSISRTSPPTITTTTKPFLQPTTTTLPISANGSLVETTTQYFPKISTAPNVTTTSTTSTTTKITDLLKYYGYILLNTTSISDPPLTKDDVNVWLSKRTGQSLDLYDFKQQHQENITRKKRSTEQYLQVTYNFNTNSTTVSDSFKKSENNTDSQTVRNYPVMKSYLWLANSSQCPDNSQCSSDNQCRINESGTFYCSTLDNNNNNNITNNNNNNNNNNNLLGLIAIPCIILLIIIIVVVVLVVRRKRMEKQKQDLTKIHPATFRNDNFSKESTETKKYTEGFSSVNSSNFEFDNQAVENGLY